MINSNIIFKKDKVNNEKKKHQFLIELEGIKKEIKNKKRKKLNLSLIIDISGSMGMSLSGNQMIYSAAQNLFSNHTFEEKSRFSKLELVKKAAINAINGLNNGDFISVVAFDDRIEKIVNATTINENNKIEIINAINLLQPRGMTNLHGGWLEGCKEISKNIKNNFLNRAILLTDGQANHGQRNKDVIIQDILNVYNNSISTTCFGVGKDFNEDLLLSISSSGGGNFYYIENENDIKEMFEEEFNGINQLSGYDCKLEFFLEDHVKLTKSFNELKKEKNIFLLPNILKNKQSFIFELQNKKEFDFNKNTFGKFILRYKDSEGNEKKLTKDIIFESVNQKTWKKLEENEEFKVLETLLQVANLKEKASIAVASGDLLTAKSLINESMNSISGCSIHDERLSLETENLEATLLASNTKDQESLKKDLFYQSYKTRTNK